MLLQSKQTKETGSKKQAGKKKNTHCVLNKPPISISCPRPTIRPRPWMLGGGPAGTGFPPSATFSPAPWPFAVSPLPLRSSPLDPAPAPPFVLGCPDAEAEDGACWPPRRPFVPYAPRSTRSTISRARGSLFRRSSSSVRARSSGLGESMS